MPQPLSVSPLPKVLVAAALAGAGAGFMLHTRQNQRSALALQIQNDTYLEEGEDEPYQRLRVPFWQDDSDDDDDKSQGDIVFEAEEEPKEQDKQVEEEELLPASRVLGVGRRKPLTEEEAERIRQWEAQRQERTRFWGKFEVMCPHTDDDEDEDDDDDDEGSSNVRAKQNEEARKASKISLRYPPWMRVGEANEVALFTIMGASPQGQQEGVVDMLTLLTTMPPVHRMRELYEFHRGMRDEIGKQARIVTPRMRWVVAGRPALGFVCAFTGFGKTLVSTYVVTAYDQRGFVLVFNSVHDAELPLEQCVARHKRESNLAFEDILRSVSFRRATLTPSHSAASMLSPFYPSS